MVGSYAVGKTSLVRRYVESIFNDRYLTTVGVRLDKKRVDVDGCEVNMVLWDLAGEDEISPLRMSHLRGAAGYILVADGCRAATLEKAVELQGRVQQALGPVPFILALNKADLIEEWEVTRTAISELEAAGWQCIQTSAKTGDAVEQLFLALATKMLSKS